MKKRIHQLFRHKQNLLTILPFFVLAAVLLSSRVVNSADARTEGRISRSFFQSPLPTSTYTPVPSTPTFTPVPPTPTFTPVPPTPTFTPVPPTPTFTPVPPTPTNTPTPEEEVASCLQLIETTQIDLSQATLLGAEKDGIRQSLENHLRSAYVRLEEGNNFVAVVSLRIFRSRINRQLSLERLSGQDAALLVSDASSAIACILDLADG